MIVQPKIRGFICTTAHPAGCAYAVKEQIDYVKGKGLIAHGHQKALVIGASTGYGLASRITASFGLKAATVGVFFEKGPEEKRTATSGWYNTVAFEQQALREGLYVKSFNTDAFSPEAKEMVVDSIKKDLGKIDLVIYSLASPRRKLPNSDFVAKSVLKPIVSDYINQSIDMEKDELITVTLKQAIQDEIDQTVAVMGGEDWELWMEALEKNNLLENGCKTVAYSYIGPEITKAIYRDGTIGRAKDHLEATAKALSKRLSKIKGSAFISVNKALVTQSSSAIPVIPLYFILLNKVMSEKGINESCIAQIDRLFRTQLYNSAGAQLDAEGRIRMDDFEVREDVQQAVEERWARLTQENLRELTDLAGYHEEFLKLFGFGIKEVDYNQDLDINIPIPSMNSMKV